MLAATVDSGPRGTRLELGRRPEPVPGTGEITVRVLACGLNHSDLHLLAGRMPTARLPVVPGSEVVGRVVSAGAGVSDPLPGQVVLCDSNVNCGDCAPCRDGREHLCTRGEILGVSRDGGLAQFMVTAAHAVLPLPDGCSPVETAAAALAGATALHALDTRAAIQPGDHVLVTGASGAVGTMALQVARLRGARAIALTRDPAKAARLLDLGATAALVLGEADTLPARVRALTDGRGADVALDHVGGDALNDVLGALRRGGAAMLCGATAGAEPRLRLWPLFARELSLLGSVGASRSEFRTLLALLAEGRLRAVLDAVVPLRDVRAAYDRLAAPGRVGKVVVVVDEHV